MVSCSILFHMQLPRMPANRRSGVVGLTAGQSSRLRKAGTGSHVANREASPERRTCGPPVWASLHQTDPGVGVTLFGCSSARIPHPPANLVPRTQFSSASEALRATFESCES